MEKLWESYGNFMEFLWDFYGNFYGNFIGQMIQVIENNFSIQQACEITD